MIVLVTGGAGFIGSHFIERLRKEQPAARIVCLDDFDDYYAPELKRRNIEPLLSGPAIGGVTLIEGSILDESLIERLFAESGFTHVMHLAGLAGVRSSVQQPLRYEQVNVRGTLVLLEAARRYSVERFSFVSSSTVYGAGAGVPFVEVAPLGNPLSFYGVTKLAAEGLARFYHRVHGVPVVMLRPFSVYGPRMRPDLAIHVFATALERGEPIPLFGDGSYRRDFTHVSDVVGGLLTTLTAPGVAGQAINLGHHEPVAMLDLVRLLEAELGREAKIDFRPAFAGDMPVTCADLTKAGRLLGYVPRVSLAEGVSDFVRWFRGR